MNQETSLTLAIRTSRHPVPGIPAALIADLFCMHAPAVQAWVQQAAGRSVKPFTVIAADPGWRNPGNGTDSVTIPLGSQDSDHLTRIRAAAAEPVTVRRGDLQTLLALAARKGALAESPDPDTASRLAEAAAGPGPVHICFFLGGADGVEITHDGATAWQESSFDSLGQYLRGNPLLGQLVILDAEVAGETQ